MEFISTALPLGFKSILGRFPVKVPQALENVNFIDKVNL
jgi:hypothetical protein